MNARELLRRAAEMRILATKHTGKFADECRAEAIRCDRLAKLAKLGAVVVK